MARIGFIGLGNMGLPMAQNLIKAGHQVEGVDVTAAATDKLKAAGGAVAETAQDRGRARRRGDHHAAGRRAGARGLSRPGGIIENANAGTLLIDCSTIDVATARDVAAAAEARGLHDARRAGVGRRRRRGRRARSPSWSAAASAPSSARSRSCSDGQDHRACRRRRQRAGGEDLQQHDPRRLDDRGVGGVRARREARPRQAEAVRHRVEVVGPVLVDDELLPGARAWCRPRRRTATTRRASPPR